MKVSILGAIRSLMGNSDEKKTNATPSASKSMPTTRPSQLTGLTEIKKPKKQQPYNLGNDSSSSFGCRDALPKVRLISLPSKPVPLPPGAYENPRRAPLPPGSDSTNSRASADGFVARTGIQVVAASNARPKKEVAPPQFFSKKRVDEHRTKILNELKAQETRAGGSFLDMGDSDTDS